VATGEVKTKGADFDMDEHAVRVVIETPKGCRNKFKYDPKLKRFRLDKVLPAGSSFPYDFGYVPGTLAEDGDPLDVLLLMDESPFPGCVVPGRLAGAKLNKPRPMAGRCATIELSPWHSRPTTIAIFIR
jgi:inorganic pyrophosphatase